MAPKVTSFEGRVESVHVTAVGSAPMVELDTAVLTAGYGIEGDRYALGTGHYSDRPHLDRQVTLIESEALQALERDHGVQLLAVEHRRNLTTSGVPLNHLVGQYFWVGSCLLFGGRLNVPCSYLEGLVEKRVFRRLVNRSGLNARILIGGAVHAGDSVCPAVKEDLDQVLVANNEATPVEPAPDVL